jgi:hypothetical protein
VALAVSSDCSCDSSARSHHLRSGMCEMTVAELIAHLRTMPPDLPVYVIDSDRDWLPLHAGDVRCYHFSRNDDFYVTIENDFDPPNGVGVGI